MASIKSLIDSIDAATYNHSALIAILRAMTRAGAQSGRLEKSGANLVLLPVNGNVLPINSNLEEIPDAGVTLAPTSLSVGTSYYIYAYMVSGVMTLEASTTAYVVQAGTGVIIKSGDATRTLVGWAYVIAGPNFVDTDGQRLVLSWANRRIRSGRIISTAVRTTASAPWVLIDAEMVLDFAVWANMGVRIGLNGRAANGTLGSGGWSAIGIDSSVATESGAQLFTSVAANDYYPIGVTVAKHGLTEGYHQARAVGGRQTSGTVTWGWGAIASDALMLSVDLEG